MVTCIAGQINQPRIRTGGIRLAGMAGHYVGIHVYRVDGIHHGDAVLMPENVENISAIAFRSVGNKDFVIRHLQAASAIIILGDRVPEKFVSLLWAVPAKGLPAAHFVDRLMHGLTNRGGKRFGDIADPASDDAFRGTGILRRVGVYSSRNFRKKIAGFEFKIMIVEECHALTTLRAGRQIASLSPKAQMKSQIADSK